MDVSIKVALTPKEAASLSPFGENKIRKLCLIDPTFPAFKNGTTTIIPKKDFEAWLSKQAACRTGFPELIRRLANR